MRWALYAGALLVACMLFLSGCMTPEQKKEWDDLATEIKAVEARMVSLVKEHNAGTLTTEEFVAGMQEMYARKDALKKESADLKATGVKWYHVLWGLLTSGLGVGLAKTAFGLARQNKIAGVLYDAIEISNSAVTKKNVASVANLRGVGAAVATEVAARFPVHKGSTEG